MQFVIEPHRGIEPVMFGMMRQEVAAAMAPIGGGLPKTRSEKTDCFFRNAFQVAFDDSDHAYFIEVASGLSFAVMFAGQDVFDIPADGLLALIEKQDQPDPALSRPPESYIFPNLILTLWGRDKQYDHKGGQLRPMFAAVGIGTPRYLAAIRTIRQRASRARTE